MFRSEENGIAIELLNQNNVEACAACVAEVFSQREPLARFLGLRSDEIFQYTKLYYPLLIEDRLTLVARDLDSGRVIGARVSEDLMREMPPEEFFTRNVTPKLFPIFTLLEELNKNYTNQHQIDKGAFAHMFMIAVSEGYLNRGIAPAMNRVFFEHARSLGYTHAITEPTGLISQHVLRDKLGFEVLAEQRYDDWLFNGKAVFRGIREHTSAMLMMKKL